MLYSKSTRRVREIGQGRRGRGQQKLILESLWIEQKDYKLLLLSRVQLQVLISTVGSGSAHQDDSIETEAESARAGAGIARGSRGLGDLGSRVTGL